MTAPSPRRLRPERAPLLFGSVLLAVGLGSCTTTVASGATVWSAELRQGGLGGIHGMLAVSSSGGGTTASMQITSGQSGATYAWRIANGDCTSEGALVGGHAAYPPLVPGADGKDTEDATLAQGLTSGGSYAVRILQDSGNGTEQELACAVLVQTT
jgi:hypothetical protein